MPLAPRAPSPKRRPSEEDPKTEEPAKEEPKTEAPAEAAAKDSKAEATVAEEAKPAEPEPEEKTVVVAEEKGTKTVEAIEEAVVPVAFEPAAAAEAETPAPAPVAELKEDLIWGVPLVGDDKHVETVLLKFLCAWEFRVKEAMVMLKVAVLWRKRFGIDALLGADLGLSEMENVVFYRSADREGPPVCYNIYHEFQDKELYKKAFGDEENRERFLKWRIQLLERGIREQLDFAPSGICSMVQVTDLKNSPPMDKATWTPCGWRRGRNQWGGGEISSWSPWGSLLSTMTRCASRFLRPSFGTASIMPSRKPSSPPRPSLRRPLRQKRRHRRRRPS